MLGSQVVPVTGSFLRTAAGSAPQCHTSDTAYWTVAVASISHEHGKFLRFGFPPFDRNNIQVSQVIAALCWFAGLFSPVSLLAPFSLGVAA